MVRAADVPSPAVLVAALQRVTRRVVGLTAQAVIQSTREPVTLPQYRALVVVATRETTTAGDLAAELGVSAPAVSRMIRTLSERGLLVRREDPDDRRSVRLTLTRRAQRFVDDVSRTRERHFRRAIRGFTKKERAALLAGLERFERGLGT